MIDGLWLRATLSSPHETDSRTARQMVSAFIDGEIARLAPAQNGSAADGGDGRAAHPQPYRRPLCRRGRREDLHQHQSGDRRGAGGDRDRRCRTEVERAVAAAKIGQARWAAMTGAERGRVMKRVADILRARNAELARLETLDTGKPIQETSVVDVDLRAPIASTISPGSRPASPASISISGRRPSAIRGASRSASSPASARGTIRSRSPAGSRRRRSPAAMR